MPFQHQNMGLIILALLLSRAHARILAQPQVNKEPPARIDIIGDTHHSQYNFTDIIIPYYGVDSWIEMRFTYWLDDDQTLAPYISLLGSWMFYMPQAEEDIIRFDWQRYFQGGVGLQWYPFDGKYGRGIRTFGLVAGRLYNRREEKSQYSDLVEYDIHLGADYYFDNLFPGKEEKKWYAIAAWSNLTFRFTNFSLLDYHTLLWTGNVKFGWRKEVFSRSILYPYLVLDWTTTYPHRGRWWENYTHLGGGLRVFPFAFKKDDSGRKTLNYEFLRRLHFYGEWLWGGIWWHREQGKPPARVNPWDLRFGFGFSTPGFLNIKDKEPRR